MMLKTTALIFTILIIGNSSVTQFPKILWTYWDSGIDSTIFFTRLCLKNKGYFANQSGWEYRFITKDNITDYISPQNWKRINNMIQSTKYNFGTAHIVDIYRYFLIYEHGGMWLDSSILLLGNLSWLDNLKNQPFVYNKVQNYPEILTFSYNDYYGRALPNVIDSKQNASIYLYPGVESWGFAAKKNSLFLKQTIDTVQHFLKVGVDQAYQLGKNINIKLNHQASSYFFTSNYPFQYILQKKQKQLDEDKNSPVKYAVQYYKMWSIDAQFGPLKLIIRRQGYIFPVLQDMMTQSLQEMIQKIDIAPYLLKFTGGISSAINNHLFRFSIDICMKYRHPLSENSVINKYLFQLQPEDSFIQSLRSVYLKKDNFSIQRSVCSVYNYALEILFIILDYVLSFVLNHIYIVIGLFLFMIYRKVYSTQSKYKPKNPFVYQNEEQQKLQE